MLTLNLAKICRSSMQGLSVVTLPVATNLMNSTGKRRPRLLAASERQTNKETCSNRNAGRSPRTDPERRWSPRR